MKKYKDNIMKTGAQLIAVPKVTGISIVVNNETITLTLGDARALRDALVGALGGVTQPWNVWGTGAGSSAGDAMSYTIKGISV